MHKSRLGAIIVDCKTDDLESEALFWAEALGGRIGRKDERYIEILGDPSDPGVILQKVDHPSWIHIDIESDDIETEVARLEKLGAVVVEKMARWTVMQAPSGHRFCVIGVRREGFDKNANTWDKDKSCSE